MLNDNEKLFLSTISKLLPNRKQGKRGPKPIKKEILLEQIFQKIKHNLRWEDLEHSTVCYNYFQEMQRRGNFKKIFNQLTSKYNSNRQKRTIVDSSDLESHKVNQKVRYSGKYHNYCFKMTTETTEECIPIDYDLTKGTESDSKVLERMLKRGRKLLPYEIFLDKGYEKYERRRYLKGKNCQVRMEMKRGKNKKRGPRFKFTEEHKKIRGSIEKVFSWIKSFLGIRYNRLKKWALIKASFIFVLCYIVFSRSRKL